MNGVEFLIGKEELNTTPLTAYSDEAIAFLSDLSGRLMKSPMSRAYPDIAALAFWARKGNLGKLKDNCPEADKRLGRGLCFHIAPSNIPINFAFTFFFGLLSGCSNIVRIPSKRFPQTEMALEAIKEILKDHPEIESRTAFVRYTADNEITAKFCRRADARMIWGGDSTVRNIKMLETKPKCIDVCFADRYSICILDGNEILQADETRIQRLAEDFYNDTYLMDQNACSSPQMIYWINDQDEARNKFWNAVYDLAEKKYDLQAAVAVDKYTLQCEDAINHADTIYEIKRRGNLLYRAQVQKLEQGIEMYRGHGGYFYEHAIGNLNEIAQVVIEKYQTVTYFGIDPEVVRSVVIDNHLKGIDRIAPVGKAMDVGVIWDGFDLVRVLSRLVNIE